MPRPAARRTRGRTPGPAARARCAHPAGRRRGRRARASRCSPRSTGTPGRPRRGSATVSGSAPGPRSSSPRGDGPRQRDQRLSRVAASRAPRADAAITAGAGKRCVRAPAARERLAVSATRRQHRARRLHRDLLPDRRRGPRSRTASTARGTRAPAAREPLRRARGPRRAARRSRPRRRRGRAARGSADGRREVAQIAQAQLAAPPPALGCQPPSPGRARARARGGSVAPSSSSTPAIARAPRNAISPSPSKGSRAASRSVITPGRCSAGAARARGAARSACARRRRAPCR